MEDDSDEAEVPGPRATLYRLIAAGQLAHRALIAPLIDRGLEAGDDAILFLLYDANGMTEGDLALATGAGNGALSGRLDRLCARDLVARRAVGGELLQGFALTDRGERVAQALAGTWMALDETLLGTFDHKVRRRLDKALKHVLTLLDG